MSSGPRLLGKIALITGASSGLGASHARVFVSHGAKVVLADRERARGRSIAEELGSDAHFIHLDVTNSDDWSSAVAETEVRFGPINVLVNNAGIFAASSLEDLQEEAFRRMIDVNQVGVLLGMQAVLSSMRRAGGGSIINISSCAGFAGLPNMLSYVATKFAVRGMTKVAALELGKDNIRVNSVHPGTIETPMTVGAKPSTRQPIPRFGSPREVSDLLVFLAADESSFCTGAEYVVDFLP